MAHEYQLDEDTARNAIKLTRWFIHEQINLLAANRLAGLQERGERLRSILERNQGHATVRELQSSHGFTREELVKLSSRFSDLFSMTKAKPASGRPSELVFLMRN